MPARFYFHLVRGHQRITDRVGMTMPREVVNSPEVLEKVRERWPGTDDLIYWEAWSVEIVDATTGDIVRTIALI
jgi:hypothetical protein